MSEHDETILNSQPIGCLPTDPNACQTYTGRYVNLWKFTPDDAYRPDIIASLAKICRFNGHCITFYSVAQHSVHVAERVYQLTKNPGYALVALYHDAHEAYTGDVPRPIKRHQDVTPIRNLMNIIQHSIEVALELTRYRVEAIHKRVPLNEIIKLADNEMLRIEATHFMKGGGREWDWPEDQTWTRLMVALSPARSHELMHNYDMELRELIDSHGA